MSGAEHKTKTARRLGSRANIAANRARRGDQVASSGGRPSLAEYAYSELRTRIIRLDLPPGSRFSELEAASWLGLGKTPVREALSRLGHQGLIQSLPRVGYEVTPITLKDVHQLFQLRLIVEPAIVEMAAGHVDPVRLARLDALCQEAVGSKGPENVSAFLRLNSQFHVTVAEATGNSRLVELERSVLEESERLYTIAVRLLDRTGEMVHEHRELIDALGRSNRDAAKTLTVDAIEGVRQQVVTALMSVIEMTVPVDLSGGLDGRGADDRASRQTNTARSTGKR